MDTNPHDGKAASAESNPGPEGLGFGGAPCSELSDALALVDFGACRDGDPAEWINVASPMCKHCKGTEDVNLAAARIIAVEYRRLESTLSAIEEIYTDGSDTYNDWRSMGEIARKAISFPNTQGQESPTKTN